MRTAALPVNPGFESYLWITFRALSSENHGLLTFIGPVKATCGSPPASSHLTTCPSSLSESSLDLFQPLPCSALIRLVKSFSKFLLFISFLWEASHILSAANIALSLSLPSCLSCPRILRSSLGRPHGPRGQRLQPCGPLLRALPIYQAREKTREREEK